MSYEEFLNLPVNHITQFAQNIRFKRENDIPFSKEELTLERHFVRYTKDVRMQEDIARLEYFYGLDDYKKKST